MFESLSDRLQEIVKSTSKKGSLTEENMADALREVRRALLEADVNLKVVKAFISKLKDRAEGEQVIKSVTPGQQLVKIVNDELVALMGGSNQPISNEGDPSILMLLGLQGSGKTTSAAKLALKLRKDGRKPLLVAADVYRPAAVSQLQILGKQIDIPVFSIEGSVDVRRIVTEAIEHARNNGNNTVIIDTAGRLQIDTEMMAELMILDRLFNPAEKLLVVDSMTGQEAVNVAQAFNEQLGVTGMILTKLDGDARGGAALSIVHITGKPIKFAGMGEKLDALELFHPERIAQRILGMGDIISLVEKAQETFDLDQAKELGRKMKSKEFSFDDFMNIQKQMKMFGSMDQILGMLPLPGIDKATKQQIAHSGEQQLKKVEAYINSMTPNERKNPDLLNSSRKKRIAAGSGVSIVEFNKFIKEFENMRVMMKKMSNLTSNKKHSKGKFKLPHHLKGKFPGF